MELRDANGALVGAYHFYIGENPLNEHRPIVYYTQGLMTREGSLVWVIESMNGQQQDLTASFARTLYPLSEGALTTRIQRGLTSQERRWLRRKVRATSGESPLIAILKRNNSE